jgi:hypothetical protein
MRDATVRQAVMMMVRVMLMAVMSGSRRRRYHHGRESKHSRDQGSDDTHDRSP